jgi:hypothetical protein
VITWSVVENANGITGNTLTGRKSNYIVEDRRNDSKKMNLTSIYNSRLSDHAVLTAGIDLTNYKGDRYTTVDDLLGGDFYLDINKFAERDFSDPDMAQSDLNHPNRVVKVGDIFVGALVVVNAFGDVVDDETGQIIAGTRDLKTGREFVDTFRLVQTGDIPREKTLFNTTLGVVATNAALNRPQTNKLARMAQNGLVKTIYPINSNFDGDVVFSASTGGETADLNVLGAMADAAMRESVKRAVRLADGFGILPTSRDILDKSWKIT